MNPTDTQGSTTTRIIISILLSLTILAAGVGGFYLLKYLREDPEVQIPNIPAPLVAIHIVRTIDKTITVKGFGTVRAKVNVQLIPQVSGKVIDLHPDMVDGGYFRAGETLITIDPRNYELAVQQAQALVASSQVKLEREIAESQVAKKEWDNLHPNQQPSSLLVLREPQIKQARAELQAANAQLNRAKLDLERTKLSLPFDGRIVRKTIDRGQFISAGQSVASVYGTDVMEIPVPLENSELAWFHLPKPNHHSRVPLPNSFGGADISNSPYTTQTHYPNAASAQVHLRFGGADHQWTGRVVRTQAHIDPATRMAYVIIEVDEPFQNQNKLTALLPGMFVDVAITGKTLKNVLPVPIYAVHNTNEVWIARNNTLLIQKVRIARQDEQFAYITQGLTNNDQVILTPLDTVTHHMKIRTTTQQTPTVRERASTEQPEPTGSNP